MYVKFAFDPRTDNIRVARVYNCLKGLKVKRSLYAPHSMPYAWLNILIKPLTDIQTIAQFVFHPKLSVALQAKYSQPPLLCGGTS